MADSQINVIKSKSGFDLKMPKFSGGKLPKSFVAIFTIILAVVSVISAIMLYRSRSQPQVPTPTGASATFTIQDDFATDGSLDGTKWGAVGSLPENINIAGGKLVVNIPAGTAAESANITPRFNSQVVNAQGDFDISVDLNGISPEGGYQELAFGSVVAIRRTKTSSTETLSTYYRPSVDVGDYNTNQVATVNLPANTSSVRVRLLRVDSTIQTSYDLGQGYVLQATVTNAFGQTDEALPRLFASNVSPQFAAITSVFDNFTALINLGSGIVTPTPNPTLACPVNFTIFDTEPTPTVTQTPTPGPSATPTPTATPGPTSTPTPTVPVGSTPTPTTPASCNQACSSNANCSSGLTCNSGLCRNPLCTAQTNCSCTVTSTPTPTTITALVPTATPVTLQEAGSVDATWLISIGGIVLLGLGGLLLFAL